jgi:hypothetical protein
MVVIVFLAWAAPSDVIETLGDAVQEMDDNNDTAGRLIITLGALALAVFGLLVIVLELAPEDEERELRVKQAGTTTIVPAQALRLRLEEALVSLPEVSTAKARVWTRDNGIATNLDLALASHTNVANVTQESSRIVTDIIQTELGLPVAGTPTVRVSFGGEQPSAVSIAVPPAPVASSVSQAPAAEAGIQPQEMLGGAEDAPPAEPPVIDATEETADASPERYGYGGSTEGDRDPSPTEESTEGAGQTDQPQTERPQEAPDTSLRSRLYGGEPESGPNGEPGGPTDR